VSLFFVPIAPPLFIPWSEVSAHDAFMDRVSWEVVELSCLDALHARLPAVRQERIEPLRSYLAARSKGLGRARRGAPRGHEKIEKALVHEGVGEELARMQRL
jgi:hypothetical protein